MGGLFGLGWCVGRVLCVKVWVCVGVVLGMFFVGWGFCCGFGKWGDLVLVGV